MNTMIPTPPHLPGYHLAELLYHGSKTVVYRGVRLNDQQGVVVKLLRRDYPTFNELLQFRNQYAIAKNLDIPGIVRPDRLEAYGNSYALVMEDFGGVSLRDYEQVHTLGLAELLAIAIQLTTTLHDLGKNRVIHKDIKPANIIIHPDNQEVKLIDFSIASLLPKEMAAIKHPNVLEGTLAYLAPEQTGRMNRGIDYRTDFYALGVTLFELLTGQLPFQSDDPMELVHCHIAKPAPAVCDLRPEIPEVLGQIVAKLMAKNAEDRYQSALGLKHDLERCLQQVQTSASTIDFKIGQRDLGDRFILPEKLYGRESEVATLLHAFDRVSEGRSEMILVAGFSGIGKTAVVHEVHKPIVRQRGSFIKGKFDQFNRNIPFSAIVQACRDLMGQLLSESDTRLRAWQVQILQALGADAQVIVDVIPELERIIGPQPVAIELTGTAAQNRFNLLFQKFIRVFTLPNHPLVMFLDDLQWADLASLHLLQRLMTDSVTGYLLVIGAYRDNEVSATHPLMMMLNTVDRTRALIRTITLPSLNQASLNALVADTLNCQASVAQPLAHLVAQKTHGNPFFATQFLKSLHQEGLIVFDQPAGHWQCDIAGIGEAALTDDVVEFMTRQLQKLPAATQTVLKLAACIGNPFDLATLAIVSQRSLAETAADLWRALQEGLILPQGEVYKFYLDEASTGPAGEVGEALPQTAGYRFLHDRVQQAAYSLILESDRAIAHHQIGHLLLRQLSPAAREERIFAVVNQLNYGVAQVTDLAERDHLAELNLLACRKARAATAYQAARDYAELALALLGPEAWQRQYTLTLTLHNLAAEVASLCGDFDAMNQWIDALIHQAHTPLEQVGVYLVKIQAFASQNQLLAAIATAQVILQHLGIGFPADPTAEDVQQAVAEINALIGDRSIESLFDLPPMVDARHLAIMEVAASIMPICYIVNSPLYPFANALQVKLSIQSGNSVISSYSYAFYGTFLAGFRQDIALSTQFGQLAYRLASLDTAKTIRTRTLDAIGYFLHHRQFHLRETLPILQASYQAGLETGRLDSVGYAIEAICLHSFWCGQPLAELEPLIRSYRHQLIDFNQRTTANYCLIFWETVLFLLSNPGQKYSPARQARVEAKLVARSLAANDQLRLLFFYLHRLMLRFLMEDAGAAADADQARLYRASAAGTISEVGLYFYDSLTLLAALPTDLPAAVTAPLDWPEQRQRVQANQAQLQHWAQHAPMNHGHKWQLVEAELCRVLGQKSAAIDGYDQAIAGAKANGYLQEEAIANELAAKFYLSWGKSRIAAMYLQDAYYAYARWGAKAKTAALEQRYPDLLAPILQQAAATSTFAATLATIVAPASLQSRRSLTASDINTNLDFTALLQVSQSLASTIQLDVLVQTLTQTMLANSGADKCVLLLAEEGEWSVRVITDLEQTVLQSVPLLNNPTVPTKLIQYVKNTLELVVIDDLDTTLPVLGDYLHRYQPQSVLCLPILHQGNLAAILYLENRSAAGVFTHDRLAVLNLLSSQAAIALENARLYHRVQRTLDQLQQAQLQMVQSEKMSALGNLVAGIAHEINNPVGCIVGNVGMVQDCLQDLLDVIDLYQAQLPQPGAAIADKLTDIDLDYLRSDLPELIRAMKDGGNRIKAISKSLRVFSRADSDHKRPFNLHEGIDSTLLILRHRLKANDRRPEIEVLTHYGDIPHLDCFPGQLNQVFMNILANAIDALDDVSLGRSFAQIQASPNRIMIRTDVEHEHVTITIADNGPGIPEAIKSRIFDHLFTTKAVGQGTGFGLAIARQIITDKHGGWIEVKSMLGTGTEFVLILPIKTN
jgi:predicted ATPase/signal transduction histidine kinase